MRHDVKHRREFERIMNERTAIAKPVWSKISNALKRLGFRSHNFLAQLLSETSRA